MIVFFIVLVALLIDRLIGEPKRWHPLVGFGGWAKLVEDWFFAYQARRRPVPEMVEVLGIFAVLGAVVPLAWGAYWLSQLCEPYTMLYFLFNVAVLYVAIGAKSLAEHARLVEQSLVAGDIVTAREKLSHMVSRDTEALDNQGVTKGVIESVLENGPDATFSAIFWYLLAGVPGVVVFRLVNTLDAMWGYRNQRYRHFGWFAAYLDDLLNFIPARLSALSYACLGNYQLAMACWRGQAQQWNSPNAGPVMAAGAGALDIQLGGEAVYGGKLRQRPVLGTANEVTMSDITRALSLLDKTALMWLLIIFLLGFLGLF